MKLRCLLIDDEPPALQLLSSYIGNIDSLEIVGQCKNALEALTVLNEKTVDVIFLDIKMPKIIGTDFIKNLSRPPKVIFVTAYREFALDGYELDAVDYLVKPVSFERFFKAIMKLNRLMGLDVRNHEPKTESVEQAFVYLKVDRDMKKIYLNDILYIESWKYYVKIFLLNGSFLLVKQSITSMENLLSQRKFMRIHRSYMVSLSKIIGYNNIAVQLGETEIPIGRLYKQSVMERLEKP